MRFFKFIQNLPLALLAFHICASTAGRAEGMADAAQTPPLVGNLSRGDTILFEGNKTFSGNQLLRALSRNLDYHVASHREAPLPNYTAFLRQQLTTGYRCVGFPDTTVEVSTSEHQMVIRVNEGPRLYCRDLILAGPEAMTNEVVRRKFEDALKGANQPKDAGIQETLWAPGHPAPFDEISRKSVIAKLQDALVELNFVNAKINAEIVPDRARERADLKVEISDAGARGVLEEIEVTGLHINTKAQMLDYLDLKAGVELQTNIVATTSNRLWQSARFFRQDVKLLPLSQVGKFKLTIDLDEVREAPALTQAFSEKESAMLRFRDWLAGWEKRPEDFVISISPTNSALPYVTDITLSKSGFAMAIWEAFSNRPAKLQYGVVAADETAGFYSAWRKSKFIFQRPERAAQLSIRIRPTSQRSYGTGAIGIFILMGVEPTEPPLGLSLDLEPAVFLSMAYDKSTTLNNRTLTLSNKSEDVTQTVLVDAPTGRLLEFVQFSSLTNSPVFRIRSDENAFTRTVKEIAAATKDHPNQYLTNHGFSSWLSYMAADLTEFPLVEQLIDWSDEDSITKNKEKSMLAVARAAVRHGNLERLFDPLNRLFVKPASADRFSIPVDVSSGSAEASMSAMASVFLGSADNLFPRDSWSWVLLRETIFTTFGKGRYSQAEMERLLKSEDLGPIGCLAIAYLQGKANPLFARRFAERGIARLMTGDFRKDYTTLTQTNSIVGDLFENAFLLASDFAQDSTLVAKLGPNEKALVDQLAQRLRAPRHGPVSEAAWPAFEQYWDASLGKQTQNTLNRFLPQSQFLTDSQALYEHGLGLVSPESAFQDFDEAARCFRKAAVQGHAGAQLQLGILSEGGKGSPQDFAQAMQWYRAAARQNELHAACFIATLYHDGKGVSQDLDEAIKWYRVDAEKDCIRAQFNLASILESRRQTDESMKWYRRAAERGATPAQAKLGDMLSEGFFTAPDYVEACQWLILATEAGDKISEIRLRRVKSRLGIEQIHAAESRSEEIKKRIQEYGKTR